MYKIGFFEWKHAHLDTFEFKAIRPFLLVELWKAILVFEFLLEVELSNCPHKPAKVLT